MLTSANLKMFDLFAGCGGLSLGMEQAGFTPIFVNELNDDARSSYLRNRSFELAGKPFNKRHELHSSDIYEMDDKYMENLKSILIRDGLLAEESHGTSLDLICGGPPCQGYSGIGHRRSYAVDKKDIPSNQLYDKMAEVIEFFRPKIFLFENVKGLLSSRWTSDGDKGGIWKAVHARMNIDGYRIHWQLVSAKDYGVPQNRPRVLLVGVREDILIESDKFGHVLESQESAFDLAKAVDYGFLPQPTHDYPHPKDLLSDLLDPEVKEILLHGNFPSDFSTKNYLSPPRTDVQKLLRTSPNGQVMKKGSRITDQDYSKHKPAVVAKFSAMLENEGVIPEQFRTKKFAQRILKPEWPENGPNITATSLPDDYVHYSQPRSLTVREWARLQMFPDWYEFSGKRTTGGTRRAGNPQQGIFDREVPKYTQIGNAVPVRLGWHVGKQFRKILCEDD